MAYLTIVAYLGSAIAAPVVMIIAKLRRRLSSIRSICAWFTLVSTVIAAVVLFTIFSSGRGSLTLLMVGQSLAGTLLVSVFVAIGVGAVSLLYGVVAGLPWRAETSVLRR